jgi:carbamoyl-phosphate synthase large subunit
VTTFDKGNQAPITAVVTAVGAIIGQGIIASLRQCARPVRIIGVDRNPDGIGRFFCDHFIAKPAADENTAEYRDFWTALIRDNNVDVVLPGLESDVLFFNRQRKLFPKVALNEAQLIDLAQDKLVLGSKLGNLGLTPIPTYEGRDWPECVRRLGAPPFLLKPTHGNGSRGIVKLHDADDLAYWSRQTPAPFMIQKIVGHDQDEYTVGSFGLGDGTALPSIIFRRTLSVAGNTQYAEVVAVPALENAVEILTRAYRPVGPTNYQFRLEHDTPYLLEINPRFSSSTSLRAAFGYNEAAMSLDFYLDKRRPDTPTIVPGRAWRYYRDMVEK